MSTQNALLTILVEKINNDTLVLPTLPAIALKVRKSADDPNINLNGMADVVGQDPSLSARMIKISNSAYLGRTVKVTSTTQAVTRIGLNQVKNIATALAMEQLFVSKNEIVKKYMARMWTDTIEIVANAMAAAQTYQAKTGKKNLSLDTITLSALVANIGALPVLTEAERHDSVFANPTFLDVAIEKLSGRIGGSIMREWQFNDVFIQCAEHWRNLEYSEPGVSYIDFVRIGAALANQADNGDEILTQAMEKGIFNDIEEYQTPEFGEMRDNAKSIFA
ncbi:MULTISPECIES: HDOD domain-containing protein [Alteromonadaceae]|jgi:HD-like signal output (HDOD) protein|uniref:HDOD domain-containing protein n=1 Tax=Brumicola blandensis TaxID=3075611 RepID=A0AAW8R4Z9_9ALTE|nr:MULTISPECIES: HDOD domain-containing protein [unclassified Alteromonas]MDT0583135.1 HDOD domain-containing protein [Alteromonas sp. W409]MDT0627440.1 HDOD domain-containing protein [Alteromonas sp. W364]